MSHNGMRWLGTLLIVLVTLNSVLFIMNLLRGNFFISLVNIAAAAFPAHVYYTVYHQQYGCIFTHRRDVNGRRL
jgi:hypothetical protein